MHAALINPIQAPIAKAIVKAKKLLIPNNVSEPNSKPDKAKFAPTERSNSPPISRRVTPRTMMPISEADAKILAQVVRVKKSEEKIVNRLTRLINGTRTPNKNNGVFYT